jgi:hypothetical protein
VKLVVGVLLLAAAAAAGGIALYSQSGRNADATAINAGGITIRLSPTPAPTRTASPNHTETAAASSPTPAAAKPTPWSYPAASPPELYAAECLGTGLDSVRLFVFWNPSHAGEQYLDFSIFNNNFAPGTYLSIGSFAQDGWSYVLDGVRQGTTHYLRINTWTGTAWAPSYPLQFFTPVCDPLVAELIPAPDMAALRNLMGGTIFNSGLNAAVAITDLQTGETIDVNGYDNRLPGCTLNLFVIMSVVQKLQAGTAPEPLAGDLIAQTITRSDPILARRMLKEWVGDDNLYRGIERLNVFMQALGMHDTLFDHPPAYPEESLNGGINNETTARDANRGLRALWDGQVVSPVWRDYLLQKMTLVKPGLQYIIGSAGYDATRSHKNGFLYEQGWSDNDIGIVWFERGGQRYGYAISFYSQYLRGKYDAIPLAQEIASQAYDWFVSRYGAP